MALLVCVFLLGIKIYSGMGFFNATAARLTGRMGLQSGKVGSSLGTGLGSGINLGGFWAWLLALLPVLYSFPSSLFSIQFNQHPRQEFDDSFLFSFFHVVRSVS